MRHAVWIGLCLLVSSAAPAGQDRFERQVREQISRVGESLQKKGYELTHQVYTGQLDEEETETVTLRLRRGVRYAILGVCDQDCSDLDMRLFDPAEREIGRDVERDDVPVIEIQPDKNGEYSLRVAMAECKDEPCTFGLGVFATEQDEFDRQVRTQLEGAAKRLGQQGFELTHHIYTGNLARNRTEDVVFELERGSSYLVIGVCDNDCRDLDLHLRDANGREIDRDVERDDYPVVAVAPSRRERYTVRALMTECTAEPCRYGLGVFAR